jgi:hypothetical protein
LFIDFIVNWLGKVTGRVLMVTLPANYCPRSAVLSNASVKQTREVDSDCTAVHLVFPAFWNSTTTTLLLKPLGKFVPTNVMLSAPRTFNSVLGLMAVIVQSICLSVTDGFTGMIPKFETMTGFQSPHVYWFSRVHLIEVAELAVVSIVHLD